MKTNVQFPVPTLCDSQPPATRAPGASKDSGVLGYEQIFNDSRIRKTF